MREKTDWSCFHSHWFTCKISCHAEFFNLPTGIVGTKEYRKPDWVTQLEETKKKKKGNDERLSPISIESIDFLDEDLSPFSPDNSFVFFPDDNDLCDVSTNSYPPISPTFDGYNYRLLGDNNRNDFGNYRMTSSFHYLPPIEESSEPSSGSSVNSNSSFNILHIPRSSSYNDIANNDLYESLSDSSQSRSQTFPKCSKTSFRNRHANMTNNRNLFPLEPRELDPGTFYQLHHADSQEELQEFLLLESQCISNENGIAAAFVSDTDAGNMNSLPSWLNLRAFLLTFKFNFALLILSPVFVVRSIIHYIEEMGI